MAITRIVTAAVATLSAFCALGLGAAPSIGTAAPGPAAPGVSGSWAATATAAGVRIPFRFELRATPSGLTGWFFNGDTRVIASAGSESGGHVVLRFDQFARELDVSLAADGSLNGRYGPIATPGAASAAAGGRDGVVSFDVHARRWQPPGADAHRAPPIAGTWLIPVQSRKSNEKAWRFIVRQSGAEVDAAILRVDGDTGTLSGTWSGGHLLLSNFSGTRAELLEVAPAADGTLSLTVHELDHRDTRYTAYRLADAAARGLPGAADAARHTDVRDRAEVFRFSGVDLSDHSVASSDARFAGKVVLVDVSGSWCPNCHDEAPFLQELYRRFHRRGLEIVMLDFEEPDQLADPVRLRAFVHAYHLSYTILLDGTTDQVHDRLPQAVNLDAWPTTFFLGRDGRVKAVHTGFAAPASGQFYTRLRAAYISEIEQLLAAGASAKVKVSTRSG